MIEVVFQQRVSTYGESCLARDRQTFGYMDVGERDSIPGSGQVHER
jgi:hypothetical protein